MSKKLCYILPQYTPKSSEHYFHIYELIDDLSRSIDIFLVIEDAVEPINFKAMKSVYVLRFASFALGLLERLAIFTIIRLKGYKTFYVHQSYFSAIAASLVTRLFGGHTLYWHCGLKKDYMHKWALSWKAIKAKLFDDYAFLLAIRLVQFLVTGSETMRNYYVANFGLPQHKIKIMPNWVNLERFKIDKFNGKQLRRELELPMTSKVVLFVHWLSPRKGAQYLVKIAKEVSRTIPDVFFIIVGEGPYMETLRQEIAENGLEDSMRLVGSVPNQEIPKYYAAADLLIMPSEEEGFPRVILEAMAMDVPFVATDVGGTKDLMTENQMICIVRRGDMSSFAKKVINILKDNELREVLKREGRERIKHFSKEKVIEIFISNLACKKPN